MTPDSDPRVRKPGRSVRPFPPVPAPSTRGAGPEVGAWSRRKDTPCWSPAVPHCCQPLFAAALLLSSVPGSAGTIRGTVTDPDGRPVPGARVDPRQIRSPAVAHGHVRCCRPLPQSRRSSAGRYDLRVVASRLPRRSSPGRRSPSTDDRDVTIALHLAALAESVVVSASQVEVPLVADQRLGDGADVGDDLRRAADRHGRRGAPPRAGPGRRARTAAAAR